MIIDDKDFCICRHKRKNHYKNMLGSITCGICAGLNNMEFMKKPTLSKLYVEFIHEFKLDNLSYLEQKYDERTAN